MAHTPSAVEQYEKRATPSQALPSEVVVREFVTRAPAVDALHTPRGIDESGGQLLSLHSPNATSMRRAGEKFPLCVRKGPAILPTLARNIRKPSAANCSKPEMRPGSAADNDSAD
jgi:hypothetical protein